MFRDRADILELIFKRFYVLKENFKNILKKFVMPDWSIFYNYQLTNIRNTNKKTSTFKKNI